MQAKDLQRFKALHAKADAGALSAEEAAEHTTLSNRICAEELEQLRPAIERMAAETREVEAQNERLAELLAREQQLADNLRSFLDAADVEQREIRREVDEIIASPMVAAAHRRAG